MRLGIFGGTFNPIHLAHLITAERIREELDLGKILFIPSALPPHKDSPMADAGHRLAMARKACASNPGFEVDDLEVRRSGRSYSVDTLRALEERAPDGDLHFIIGMDAFAEISTWKEAPAIFGLTNLVVIPRPGHPLRDPREYLPRGIEIEGPTGHGGTRRYRVSGGREVLTLEIPVMDISSSDIRKRLKEGRSVRYLLPEEVEVYIRKEKLYIE